MEIFGIDVGGSGIKGAPVNIETGELTQERYRLPTPVPGDPEEIFSLIKDLVEHFSWTGKIGIGFPTVVRHGVILSAANINKKWIGVNAQKRIQEITGFDCSVLNDADAAGLAEMRFGAGRGYEKGVVLMLTLGTGIGSAIFTNGHLLPNLEFGHLELDGKDAEKRAAAVVRTEKKLTWEEWGKRLERYLRHVESLVNPDLIIIGGGVSDKFHKFSPYLKTRTKIVPAELQNQAGIVGAALGFLELTY